MKRRVSKPKPKLLDLFCGAGGAAMGYYRAGFEVIGVDINPQPHYPFQFHQADAMTFPLDEFDAIHASPPCQGYTPMANRWGSKAPRLLQPLEVRFRTTGLPFVLENVPGAPLLNAVRLCGSFFGLPTNRHRLFLSNVALWSTPCSHYTPSAAIYGPPNGRRVWTRANGTELRAWSSLEEGQQALGIDWCPDWRQLKEAIPPAYTEFIGEQLIVHIKAEKAGQP